MRKIKIAIVPTRRGISSNRKGAFTVEDALKAKNEALTFIKSNMGDEAEFINIDFLNSEGIMYDDAHADIVAEKLSGENIDGVFILQCNFGCEEAVGRLCRKLKKPVFLWGARDKSLADDGSRSTDTQCGLFASSRLLRRYGVPFTYAFNCDIVDDEFKKRFELFLGTVRVLSIIGHLRIGQINSRPKYFTSVMINESELIEQLAIEVVPLNIAMVISEMNRVQIEEETVINDRIESIKNRFDTSRTSDEKLRTTAILIVALKNLAVRFKLNGLAIECWTLTPSLINCHPCLAIAELSEEGIPCCCETDVYGVIGSLLLQAAAGDNSKVFFGEYTMRSLNDDNTELIWHCGNAPYSMRNTEIKPALVDAKEDFPLKSGDITIVRFDCDRGQFYLFADVAESQPGPYTLGSYCWAKMKNWKEWEYKFIEGPYIHHVSVAFGQYKDIFKEVCKYIPQINYDSIS